MNSQTVTLDVREDIRNGCEPFSKIMSTVARLRPDERLLLVAPFEPAPLFGVLAKQGFAHHARQMENGDWEVLFERNGENNFASGVRHREPAPKPKSEPRNPESETVEVDARGLEPPQPMVKILEALSALSEGVELLARTDRRPMHLYAQLGARGFQGQTEEQSDGSFISLIRRN